MIKNYLVIALRNMWKNKIFSLINVLGLSIGLASCMLIFLFAKDEITFDRFHSDVNNIYRVTSDFVGANGKIERSGTTGMMPGPTFAQQLPEVESFVRLQSAFFNIRHGSEVREQEALFVDENFFSFFSFPILEGDRTTPLKDPHSVVLSEDLAKKHFGNASAVGKTLRAVNGKKFESFTVTAVAKNSPLNSSIKINLLVPMQYSQLESQETSWLNFFLNTFVTLKPGSDTHSTIEKMNRVYRSIAAAEIKEYKEKYNGTDNTIYGLQPFSDTHLSTDYPAGNGLAESGNPVYSYILSGIAALVLIIACINFINLTIARSLKRSREIGIRKVVGSRKIQLVVQFMGESFLLSLLSFLLAIILVVVLLPLFNSLAGKALSFSYLLDAKLIAGYIALFIISGLLAGFYPALVLSRFNPVETLYGRKRYQGKNYLSKGLVVFQFSLATFLIIATITVYSQFSYLVNYDLGYDNSNVMILRTGGFDSDQIDLFKNEILKNPAIKGLTFDQGGTWRTNANINGETNITFDFKTIDEDYLPLFHIPIVQGRNFSKEFARDTAESVLVNESFVKKAGWKNPVGEVVDFFYRKKKYKVIGVVKDYHFASLNEVITPQLFTAHPQYGRGAAYLKLASGEKQEAISYAGDCFRRLFPLRPYSFTLSEDKMLKQYKKEAKWRQIITFSAILTVFISCIGLFGLASLSAEKRAKEIGIRKVLGASVERIVTALSADFMKLVSLAAVIAIPAAWWAMNKWLEDYPYKIDLKSIMFFEAVGIVSCIALLTVSYQSVKAAIANPVKSLRTE
jgi:putative ABC transport system permease protein